MMNLPVKRIAVIGYGGRGGGVAQTGRSATGHLMEVVACTEISDERYAQGCQNFGMTPKRYPNVKKMLASEKLDGVIIGTPNNFHLENLLDFAGEKIPILIEKPLDSTFAKICEVVRFAEKYSGPIMVGHCMRYAPILNKTQELLEQGAIGKLCSTRFVQNCHYGNTMFHNWRRKKEFSGTMFIEKATHDLDVMCALVKARPTKVFAIAKRQVYGGDQPNDLHCAICPKKLTCPESESNIMRRWGSENIIEEVEGRDKFLCCYAQEVDTPDNEMCAIQFDSGIFGTYTENFFSPRSYHHRVYEFIGTEGIMEVDMGAEHGGKIFLCKRYGNTDDHVNYSFDYLKRNHYDGDGPMTRHFYQVMDGKEQPITTVRQAFVAEVAGILATQSAEQNRQLDAMDLVPDDLKFIWQKQVY